MLPTADAEWVGAELARRFGLPLWSFTLTATDANRWAIRIARLVDGEAEDPDVRLLLPRLGRRGFAVPGPAARRSPAPGSSARPSPLAETTRVAEFNDLAGVEEQLRHGDVAAILTEPALTNIGIVLPEPGFLAGLRELATRYGALLMIDETHTFSAGPGGATALWGLQPGHLRDRQEHRRRRPQRRLRPDREVAARRAGDPTRTSSTSAGSAARWPATPCRWPRCAPRLEHVLTATAFERMVDARHAVHRRRAGRPSTGPALPWTVSQLGARAEYRFASPRPAPAASRRRPPTTSSTSTSTCSWPTGAC